MKYLFVCGLAALATATSTVAVAAPAPKPVAVAAEQIQLVPNPADFALAALRIVAGADQGQAAQIWDSASSVMKMIVSRDQFVQVAVQRHSASNGLHDLAWRSVIRVSMQQPQGQLPAGNYLSVGVVGFRKDGKAAVETVSFVLDGDQKWRLVGLTEN
jgi:hypothetical protein